MNARSFVDTNVLVYSDDHDSPGKQRIALELLAQARLRRLGVLSTQVLQEYFASVTRKLGVPAAVARRKVELFSRLDVVVLDVPDILAAIDLHRLHEFSIWDSLIIRAAVRSGCTILYTEDLQSALSIEGLEIVNPFA